MQLAERLNRLDESATLKMAKRSRQMRAQGHDIISFSLGEPDFDTPDFIKDVAIKAINDGYTYYPPVNGYLDLREAICEKLKRDLGISYSPQQVVVSTGAKQSLANIVLALIGKGDKAVIPAPYWVTYPEQIELAGGDVVTIETTVENDFKFTAEQLDEVLDEHTKLFIFSSPCNPSGTAYTKDELASFAEVFAKYPNLMIVSDEIYEYIIFEGEHHSLAQFDEIHDRVVIVNGLSKAFAMTGWRLGYMLAPEWLAGACSKIQGQVTSGACAITQRAALRAVKASKADIKYMVDAFRERRDLILDLLTGIPGVKTNIPPGAFYVLPNVSKYFGKSHNEQTINSSEDLVNYLLENAHIAMVQGEPFGVPGCVRISYANSKEQIVEGMRRMKEALAMFDV